MKDYPKHVISLPRVISFDEFKVDTKEGKYVFVLNYPIHKEILDVLSNRKKEYLIQYSTYCENRHFVEYVISIKKIVSRHNASCCIWECKKWTNQLDIFSKRTKHRRNEQGSKYNRKLARIYVIHL